VPIRCTKCGWTKIVTRAAVPNEIGFHRNLTCPVRDIAPASKPPAPRERLSRATIARVSQFVAKANRLSAQELADMD
jgi:hypothetical protein